MCDPRQYGSRDQPCRRNARLPDAERDRNLKPKDAIHEACLLRFRPILMTTFSIVAGLIPTAIGSGASTYSGDGQQGTAIGMNQNWGLAISPAGEGYFTDTNLHSIRKMSATGVVTRCVFTQVACVESQTRQYHDNICCAGVVLAGTSTP